MIEENDVEEVDSSPTEENVEEVPEVVSQEEEDVQEPTVADIATDVAPGLNQSNSDVDDMGVPYENRFKEQKRKNEKLEEKLDTILQKVEQVTQPGEKQYTKQELIVFAENNPEHKTWVDGELEKINKKERRQELREELDARDKIQENKYLKQQIFNNVINQYPDIAIKNKAGNFLGFNNKSEMFQRMNSYMNNPEIANNPRGLEVASALAYRDVNLSNSVQNRAVLNKQKSTIKNLQKQTLVEGGGKVVQPATSNDAKSRLRQSGSIKDGMEVLGDVFKKQGII